jgi:archaellum component FlaF (FlaF/FlaG flagellin family)
MDIVAYSLVLISVFVDVSTLYRSLDSRVRRMQTDREKLRYSIRREKNIFSLESVKLHCK